MGHHLHGRVSSIVRKLRNQKKNRSRNGSSDTHEIYYPRTENPTNYPTHNTDKPTEHPSQKPTPKYTSVPDPITMCPIDPNLPAGQQPLRKTQILTFQYAMETSPNSNIQKVSIELEK